MTTRNKSGSTVKAGAESLQNAYLLDTIPRARRSQGAAPSAIREILKVTERPDIISFAGGLPAEELFPVEAMAVALEETLRREGRGALQYGTTEGVGCLRDWIAHRLSQHGRPVRAEELIMTHGSQQGIDLTARVLLDPGDKVAVESPSYLAALQVFRGAEAQLVPVPMDPPGVDLAGVDRVLAEERPKFLYLVPDRAIEAKVAFVPGDSFFAGRVPGPHLRLNFSHRPEAVIEEGIHRLGQVLEHELQLGAMPTTR